jgi:CRISPR-associated protein Csb3
MRIPVDLTNPGQFFACCGLLELADRLCQGTEGWFEGNSFCIAAPNASLGSTMQAIADSSVANTMTPTQNARLSELSNMKRNQRSDDLEEEKGTLESLRRELPVVLVGKVGFRVDWFRDEFAGGSRFKTWAGQQSVLDIAQAMHGGIKNHVEAETGIWTSTRGIGLPFNFDSDLGGQGSALDIGFSFDPLAGSETTRIEGSCKPALELLAFIGLQRFRPREIARQNRFVYAAWSTPLAPSVAACAASQALPVADARIYEFRLLYRTKYLKSFLPSQVYQGD